MSPYNWAPCLCCCSHQLFTFFFLTNEQTEIAHLHQLWSDLFHKLSSYSLLLLLNFTVYMIVNYCCTDKITSVALNLIRYAMASLFSNRTDIVLRFHGVILTYFVSKPQKWRKICQNKYLRCGARHGTRPGFRHGDWRVWQPPNADFCLPVKCSSARQSLEQLTW